MAKIKLDAHKFIKQQWREIIHSRYFKLGVITFIITGLFSYFVQQKHMYAFNNLSVVDSQLNRAKGREITNKAKMRKMLPFIKDFPKDGKWQSDGDLTIRKNNYIIQSLYKPYYSIPIMLNFWESPRTTLTGQPLYHASDPNVVHDSLPKKEFDPSNDVYYTTSGQSHFEYHSVSQFMYDHLHHQFIRAQFTRVPNWNLFYKQGTGVLMPQTYFDKESYNIKNLHVYHSRLRHDQYLLTFNFVNSDNSDDYDNNPFDKSTGNNPINDNRMKELINMDQKQVVLGEYNMMPMSDYNIKKPVTFTAHFFGDWLLH